MSDVPKREYGGKMTNKEKFKEIFGIEPDCGRCNPYPCEEKDCKYWEQCENQPGCACDDWWDWEFEEPTTKNDLGVDCVSRKEVEKLVYRFLQKGTDENIAFYEHFLDLPSVTPQPCEDAVSRKDVHDMLENLPVIVEDKWFNWLQKACMRLAELPSVTPQEPRCKNCKWWKDSDGEYRRGCGAESQCPINRREVFEGNGYCFLFEPQKSEDKE